MRVEGRGPGRGSLVAKVAAVLLLAVVAAGTGGDAPLTSLDVVRFLRAGISERTILSELQTRGFAETLDPAREASLREAGASETLVAAVRRAAPAEPPAPASPAPRRGGGGLPLTTGGAGLPEPTFAVGTRTVRVPVSVLDKGGQPIMGLQREDFQVSDDGKKQKVTLFSAERRPLRIAMALDVSRSMDNKIIQVEDSLKHFIDLLEPADEIMVITFSDRAHVVQDFTSNRDQLGRILDTLEAGGGTALYDATYLAIQRVARGPAESKAVVLVTDGVDTASSVSFSDVREFARRSEVPVYSIGLDNPSELRDLFRPHGGSGHGGGGGRWPGGGGRGFPGGGGGGGWPGGGGSGLGRSRPAGFDAKPLVDLADDTGGQAVILKGPEHYTPGNDEPGNGRLKAAVESIAMTLRHRYLLGYEPPEGKGGWRTIRVEVDRKDASARARKGYYPS